MAGPTACKACWKEVLVSFARQEEELLADQPGAKEEIELVHSALFTIGQLVQMVAVVLYGRNWQKKLRPRG
jgi:hypothetical protein